MVYNIFDYPFLSRYIYDQMRLLALCSIIWSFFFTQMDVYNPTAKQQGDTHPGQDEAVTKVS